MLHFDSTHYSSPRTQEQPSADCSSQRDHLNVPLMESLLNVQNFIEVAIHATIRRLIHLCWCGWSSLYIDRNLLVLVMEAFRKVVVPVLFADLQSWP